MDWRDDRVPPRVVDAAAEHGMGALLTMVRTKALTPTERVLGGGMAFLGAPFLVAVLGTLGQVSRDVIYIVVLGVLVLAGLGAVLVAVFGSRLYLFQGGAVVLKERRSTLEVVPWAGLAPVEGEQRPIRPDANTPFPVLEIRGPRGVVFSCSHGEAVRLADVISSVELPRAWAALRAGTPVGYGPFTFTPEALVVGQLEVPWADVTRFRTTGLEIVVRGAGVHGADNLTRVFRAQVPHQRTVIALGEQLGAEARQVDRTG
jgi:hypothetical protein